MAMSLRGLHVRLLLSAGLACLAALHGAPAMAATPPPDGTRTWRDVAYGPDRAQRLDVYAPTRAHSAPVVLMVHGGGWRRGDKAMDSVVDAKVARWVPRGAIVVSIDYRMLPAAPVATQASDVARALAFVQGRAHRWGGDPRRVVLMGHSAGAHLVALVAASPSLRAAAGARAPLGTVLLDSAALDVPGLMQARHLPLHDAAFGNDPATWRALSPLHVLDRPVAPVLAVCSTRRAGACPQADAFVARIRALGGRAEVLREDLSHRQVNAQLGAQPDYTHAVEAFLGSLDPSFAQRAASSRSRSASP